MKTRPTTHFLSSAILAWAILLLPQTLVAESQKTIIQCGRIITITKGEIQDGAILIEDGKIKAVGKAIEDSIEAKVIDASNKVIIPGLIDAQSALFISSGDLSDPKSIAPELDILDAIDLYNERDYKEVVKSGVTAAYISPGNRGLIGGQGAVIKLNGSKNVKEMVLKSNAALKLSIGISSGNKSSSLSRLENYYALRNAFLDAQKYIEGWEKYEKDLADYEKKRAEEEKQSDKKEGQKVEKPQPKNGTKEAEKKEDKKKPSPLKKPRKPKRNPGKEVMVKALKGELPVRIEAHRADDIMNAMRLADEFRLKLILEKCTEGYKVSKEIAKRKIPVIIGPMNLSGPPILEYEKHTPQNPSILSQKGIKVALGAAVESGIASKFIALNAALAVSNGMDKDGALKAITITSAEILGVADRIGSIEVGKDADIVIMNGEPLNALSKVEMVIVDGKVVFER